MVALLLVFAPVVYSGGQPDQSVESQLAAAAQLIAEEQHDTQALDEMGEDALDDRGNLDPDAVLDEVERLIEEGYLNEAIELLSSLVVEDAAQLERAEALFRQIREINERYIEKFQEVNAQLQALLSEGITEEELVPTALAALGLIDEMNEIMPHPNPRDGDMIENLRYTVQLNIDRRRFQGMMDAAALRLVDEDYAAAADIYVNGIEDAVLASVESQGEGESLISLDNGLDLQLSFFEARDYGLLGDQVNSAREDIRAIGTELVTAAPASLSQAEALAQAFADGNQAEVQRAVGPYLAALESVTAYESSVRTHGVTFSDAENVVSRQAAEDTESRYDWHIRFLRDIVLGREGEPDEGLAYILDTVRRIVETDPVVAARDYGRRQYAEGVRVLDEIAWPENASRFSGMTGVEASVAVANEALENASISYATSVEIFSLSRSLGLQPPKSPGVVPELDDGEGLFRWEQYSNDLFMLLGDVSFIEDDELRADTANAAAMAGAASFLREISQRAAEGLSAASGRRTTITSLNSQRAGLQYVLGYLADPGPGTLRTLALGQALLTFDILSYVPDDTEVSDALEFNAGYLRDRISELEDYELGMVEAVAQLEYNGLSGRLASLQTRTSSAERELEGILETVVQVDEDGRTVRDESGLAVSFQTTRHYPDEARDILVPMVGPVSGTRILSTSRGDMQGVLDDARAFINRYQEELPYIASAASIINEVERGAAIADTVGEVDGVGLFAQAYQLLQTAIDDISRAEDLTEQGDAAVETVAELIAEANAANAVEDLERAGEALGQAGRLLKSDERLIQDASDLFTESLSIWYRVDVEERWNRVQADLNEQIVDAQADIVITRVQQSVREAQPLVDNQEWQAALIILETAQALWEDVFPTIGYPPLIRLLRYVETALARQNEFVLREDDPDYDKLAPLLSLASQSALEGLYEDAQTYLDQFLRAQPNNLEARLLEVDIALASQEGTLTTKVNRLIEGSLPEGVQRSDIDELESADALAYLSLLNAVQQRLMARSDVSATLLTQITEEMDLLETLLSPPPVVVVTINLQAEVDALIDRALVNGDLITLSTDELAEALDYLEQALDIDPANEVAIELLSTALRLPNAPRRAALDASEQQVLSEARALFSRGEVADALALVEQLWAVPENRNDTELNQFREELQDALRRGQ